MEISSKELSKTRHQYSVNFTKPEVGDFFELAVTNLGKKVKISGFRPGKAPKELIRSTIDQNELREEAYSQAVRVAWQNIAKELKVVPLQDPEVEIIAFAEDQPGKITFTFDIRPEVKVKGWEKIKANKVKKEVIGDKDVDNVLNSLSKGHAQTLAVLRPAKAGDRVDVTFEGSIKGVRKDKLSAAKFPMILGEASVLPGFEKELVGAKKSEVKKFNINFPKDHYDAELAGQKVDFNVTVDEVYQINLPKHDDDFGKKFGHDNIAQLRQAIKDDLENQKQEEYDQTHRAEWLAEFEKCVSADIPESLLTSEIERSKASFEQFLAERNLKSGDWLKQRKTTMEEMEKGWRRAAKSSVIVGLGLSQLAMEQGRDLKTNEDFQDFLSELITKTSEGKIEATKNASNQRNK